MIFALFLALCAGLFPGAKAQSRSAGGKENSTTGASPTFLFSDSHFHLTNYVQEGISAGRLIELMGSKVARSTLFGIPLQQQWSYQNSGTYAPTYYLQSDAPLYYYSFTDAFIAMQYRALSPADRARLDPMITGFNPADMYAPKHIERVLRTFPGVFTGKLLTGFILFSFDFTRSEFRYYQNSKVKSSSTTGLPLTAWLT
jgi:hypothetical protein